MVQSSSFLGDWSALRHIITTAGIVTAAMGVLQHQAGYGEGLVHAIPCCETFTSLFLSKYKGKGLFSETRLP